MNIKDIPNIDKIAAMYRTSLEYREYWKDATTEEGRYLYEYWDNRLEMMLSVLRYITNFQGDIETKKFLLTGEI